MPVFTTFIGVDLGGGKGKNTAVARLELDGPDAVRVVDYGTGRESPWYDDRLIAYLRGLPEALVAIDAPLSMPPCVRCQLPECPTSAVCEVPIITWFRERANGAQVAGRKPKYTPYTQRACEVMLAEDHQILPRETLGQGMGPLAARGAYLTRALGGNHLIEVYPKATLTQLFSKQSVDHYKRSAGSREARLKILNDMPDLTFAPGAWREHALDNDHKFDAIVCAYTAFLYARKRCAAPPTKVVADDGWIWFPAKA